MHLKKTLLKSLYVLIGTATILPAMVLLMVLLPVSMPAWLWLESLYDARFGSGLRPVNNPRLTEFRARLISLLACSAVAGIYLLVLQYLHWDYGPAVPHALLPLIALVVGFAALQGPYIWIGICSNLEKRLTRYFKPADDVTYDVTNVRPGENFHIYTATRRASGRPPQKVSFMCPCETGFLKLVIVHADSQTLRLEGIFSTRYFNNVHLPPEEAGDYARGILEITFSTNSTPNIEIIHWLPLVLDDARNTGITDVVSTTAPFRYSSSPGESLGI